MNQSYLRQLSVKSEEGAVTNQATISTAETQRRDAVAAAQ